MIHVCPSLSSSGVRILPFNAYNLQQTAKVWSHQASYSQGLSGKHWLVSVTGRVKTHNLSKTSFELFTDIQGPWKIADYLPQTVKDFERLQEPCGTGFYRPQLPQVLDSTDPTANKSALHLPTSACPCGDFWGGGCGVTPVQSSDWSCSAAWSPGSSPAHSTLPQSACRQTRRKGQCHLQPVPKRVLLQTHWQTGYCAVKEQVTTLDSTDLGWAGTDLHLDRG